MLPFIINVICAIIVIVCLILCLLAHYELIHGIWFMAGLIVGCTVFFGTISANIYLYQLEKRANEAAQVVKDAANGQIRVNNGSSITDIYMDLPSNTFTSVTSSGKNNPHSILQVSDTQLRYGSSNGRGKSSGDTTIFFGNIWKLLSSMFSKSKI